MFKTALVGWLLITGAAGDEAIIVGFENEQSCYEAAVLMGYGEDVLCAPETFEEVAEGEAADLDLIHIAQH